MLIRFEVSNFRSVAEPVELSMVAVDRERAAARDAPALGESLLTVAAIYGPNASGKSNVLAALGWLRQSVLMSLQQWEDQIPVEPFAFGEWPTRPTTCTLELLVGGVRHTYHLEVDASAVRYEALFHYPEKRRKKVFERDEMQVSAARGLTGVEGAKLLLTPTTLVLSALRRLKDPIATAFCDVLGGVADRQHGAAARHPRPGWASMDYFAEGEFVTAASSPGRRGRRAEALALLKLADVGVSDVVMDWMPSSERGREAVQRLMSDTEGFVMPVTCPSKTVRLLHDGGGHEAVLDFAGESDGTRAWFNLIGPVLDVLHAGAVMVLDELDASLHPTLSAELLGLFRCRDTNPIGAQLVFSTHDTSLLRHLNRDEVWLTEKRPDGSTRLGGLAEFAGERVRASRDLESAYLQGRFGAIPDTDRDQLLQSLGVIG